MGDTFYRSVGEQLGRGFLAWGAGQIDAPDDAAAAEKSGAIAGDGGGHGGA